MAVTFQTFLNIVDPVIKANKPILLRGRHGIGKSELVYQVAKRLDLDVVERRASQMTEGDLVGLPVITESSTTFMPPDWFSQACARPVVLFLDEVDRATLEVRQGIFELTDSRKINGVRLHPGTVIFAAVNGGVHGAQYMVGDMDPAELDRWSVFDVNPSVEDWLRWATTDSNVSTTIIDFISKYDVHLEHAEGNFEPGKVYPSRRSWKRFNDVLACDKSLLREDRNIELYALCSAFVGVEAASMFQKFLKEYESDIDPEDILIHGKFDKITDFSVSDHSNLLDKMLRGDYFLEVLPEGQMDNLREYFCIVPAEMVIKLWVELGRPTNNIENLTRLGWLEGVGDAPHPKCLKMLTRFVDILSSDGFETEVLANVNEEAKVAS